MPKESSNISNFEIGTQNSSINSEEKKSRLREVRSRALRKRIFYGCGAIVICFVLLLGIMYGATNANVKIRMILLIVFGSLFAASLIAFLLSVLIKNHLAVKKDDPEYSVKRFERQRKKSSESATQGKKRP